MINWKLGLKCHDCDKLLVYAEQKLKWFKLKVNKYRTNFLCKQCFDIKKG